MALVKIGPYSKLLPKTRQRCVEYYGEALGDAMIQFACLADGVHGAMAARGLPMRPLNIGRDDCPEGVGFQELVQALELLPIPFKIVQW